MDCDGDRSVGNSDIKKWDKTTLSKALRFASESGLTVVNDLNEMMEFDESINFMYLDSFDMFFIPPGDISIIVNSFADVYKDIPYHVYIIIPVDDDYNHHFTLLMSEHSTEKIMSAIQIVFPNIRNTTKGDYTESMPNRSVMCTEIPPQLDPTIC